jgi:hypothetical protein
MIDHFLYIGTSLYIFSQSYVCPKLLLKHSRSRIPSYLCTGVARQVLPFEPHLQPYLCRKPFSRNATRYVARHLFICGGFDPRPCIRLRGNELFVCGGCPAVLPVPVLSPASGCVLVLPRALPGRGLGGFCLEPSRRRRVLLVGGGDSDTTQLSSEDRAPRTRCRLPGPQRPWGQWMKENPEASALVIKPGTRTSATTPRFSTRSGGHAVAASPFRVLLTPEREGGGGCAVWAEKAWPRHPVAAPCQRHRPSIPRPPEHRWDLPRRWALVAEPEVR